VGDVCRGKHNVSEVTFHRWKKQFGQMDINEAKRLKELERENGGENGVRQRYLTNKNCYKKKSSNCQLSQPPSRASGCPLAPSQTRTCGTTASGSSGGGFATLFVIVCGSLARASGRFLSTTRHTFPTSAAFGHRAG
jgi:hypothetical protein